MSDLDALLNLVDASLSSALIVLLIVLAVLAFRDARRTVAGRILLALVVSVMALALLNHPGASYSAQPIVLILTIVAAPNVGLIWAFCLALLHDSGRLPRWTLPVIALLTIVPLMIGLTRIGALESIGYALGPYGLLPPLVAGLHLGWVAVSEYRGDLIESRRRARLLIVGLMVLASLLSILSEDMLDAQWQPVVRNGLISVPIVLLLLLWLARLQSERLAFVLTEAPAVAASAQVDPRDQIVVEQLNAMMHDEKAFLDEDLSIDRLANSLSVPVHRLRAIINTALGHRNFAAFVNGYRIEAAKAALADRARGRETVLAIAYESGFASLQSFNRVFRDMVGMTPTDYRREQLATLPNSEEPCS
jgi:AraC-like DNA-binding protein